MDTIPTGGTAQMMFVKHFKALIPDKVVNSSAASMVQKLIMCNNTVIILALS